jgi:WhiB family redox-sensing transcriptional regulator
MEHHPNEHHPDDFESMTPNRPGWMRRAACAGVEVEVFFPDARASSERARRICESCPVQAECLSFAVADRTTVGIWGGTDEAERRRLRRKKQAA